MPRRKITVKIENEKVVFSDEVINYFESIRTEENSIWIDKYFDVLNDNNNLNSEKFNLHHIRPCFTFKDKEHRNRKQTLILADKFNENIIKLSIYNHLLAHYYLWKIFDNWDSKKAIEYTYHEQFIGKLTEEKLKEFARIREEYANKNQTEEEKEERVLNYRKKNKDRILQRVNKWTENNKDRVKKNKDNWYQRNKERISKEGKEHRAEKREVEREYRCTHKDKIKARRDRPCYDPIRNDICTWSILKHRKSRNKELYENVLLRNCLINTENQINA